MADKIELLIGPATDSLRDLLEASASDYDSAVFLLHPDNVMIHCRPPCRDLGPTLLIWASSMQTRTIMTHTMSYC